MGLEGLELIMELEERFDIELPERDLEGTYTVADLYRLVVSKLEHKEAWPCLTTILFLRMRKALMQLEGVERQRITPDTDTADLLPLQHRRATWNALGTALDLKLPALERPLWMHRALLVSTPAPIVLGILAIFVKAFVVGAALLVGGIACGVIASKATKRFAVHLPAGCETLGGLVKAILARNYGKLAAEAKRSNRDEVWEIVWTTVVEELMVPADRVQPSTLLADLADWKRPPTAAA